MNNNTSNVSNGGYNNSLRKEIVDKVDIVQVIGSYVPLTKKGNNYIGLCPFHKDTNPSMSVNSQKKVFKCFSCNTGGDVVTFVSKFKNITIKQAMRELGATVGITFKLTKEEIERQKNEKYYKITSEASEFYNFLLMKTEQGEEARSYIHNRGLDDEVINRFNIGVSGENDELINVLIKKEFLPLDIIEVNLARSYADKYHDVFKNRIIFPLEDLEGAVVGFSGRRYKVNDTDSKYLNTTDTVIFKKGNILYNYHNAISSIKDEDKVYLFEGFMDVIAAVRCGANNSVASMGTALTINQIQAIKRLTKNIVVCYDTDGPGVAATLKAIDLLIQEGFNIKVMCLPDCKDADEYILKYGNQALYDVLSIKTISAIDFIYNYYFKYLLKEDVNSVETFKNNIYQTIQKFDSLTITEGYLNKLSKEINISFDTLKVDYEKYVQDHPIVIKNNSDNYSNNYQGFDDGFPQFDNVPPEYYPNDNSYNDIPFDNSLNIRKPSSKLVDFEIKKAKYVKAENTLVIAAYNSKDNAIEIKAELKLNFVDTVNREIMNKIFEFFTKYEIMDEKMIFAMLDDDEQVKKLRKLLDETKLQPDKKQIKDCISCVNDYKYDKTLDNEIHGEVNKDTLNNIANIVKDKKIEIKRKFKKEI